MAGPYLLSQAHGAQAAGLKFDVSMFGLRLHYHRVPGLGLQLRPEHLHTFFQPHEPESGHLGQLRVFSCCADIPMATRGSYRTGEFDREFVGGRRNKISMVRKGPVASVNTAPGSSICNFVMTENLIMDASTQVLV